MTVPEGTSLCGSDLPTYGGTIDDLVVFVGLFDMDGPGGVLGRAGPCAMRSSSLLPFAGLVELDIGDVDALEDDGLLEDTAMHELGHVLGIGTLWTYGSHDLVEPDCPSNDPESRFIGVEATDAHELDGGIGSPYVESDGETGTRCGHWDEDHYGHELMTGYLNRGEALARFTIGSLADLGYDVDYGAADAYTVGAQLRGADAGFELRDVLVDPSMFQER
ncbi:MAG: leishmanolysin-related zinc metalloendopeptidase [Trueperaceae bacterium]|nr:leishmanolysin-related zinc metalloendopeptidase [Trueperaceae bacterium]